MDALQFSQRPNRLTSRPADPLFWKYFGEINKLGERIFHVARAVNAYNALKAGTYAPLWDTLPNDSVGGYFAADAGRRDSEASYYQQLLKVQQRIAALSPPDEQTLNAAVVLHDVGTQADPGWDHNKAGVPIVRHVLKENPVTGVDAEAVATLVGQHGSFPNFGVDIFPENLLALSPTRRSQLFVLDCADSAARPGTGKPIGDEDRMNGLSPRTLATMEEIASQNQLATPAFFTDFRLRHLFSPSVFSRLADAELDELKIQIRNTLGPESFDFFMNTFLFRVKCRCFPVLREFAQWTDGSTHFTDFARLLAILNDKTRELFISGEEKRVSLSSKPSFFQYKPGGPERTGHLNLLRSALTSGIPADNFLSLKTAPGGKYELIIDFDYFSQS
jgi:hypothetical protein